MVSRPYLKHDIEKIEALVRTSGSDLAILKAVQHELTFRSRPKARTLAAKVEDLIFQLSKQEGTLSPPAQVAISSGAHDVSSVQPSVTSQLPPDRLAVECAKCKTPNFVSTLDGVVQHLSCSNCRAPYEARFLYGVMRTTFQVDHVKSDSASLKWLVVAVTLLIVLVLITK